MNIKTSLKKIISSIILFTLVFSPVVDFAQATDGSFMNAYNNYGQQGVTGNDSNTGANGGAGVLPNRNDVLNTTSFIEPVPFNTDPSLSPSYINSQIQNSVLATATTSRATSSSQQSGTAAKAAGCLGSQVVSSAITSAVSGVASKATDTLLNVPVAESGNVGANITTQTSAEIGTVGSLFGIGGLALPSWNSMAYCIVNTMIVYIADSTLQWINTGFEGNPAFLANPDQFFKDLANQEKVAFIQNLAYGANSGVCDVFKSSMVSAILSRYAKNQRGYGQGYQNGGYGQGYNSGSSFNGCSFDQKPGQLNLFVGGNFTEGGGWDSWYKLTQSTQNNPYDTYFRTNDRMDSQVQSVELSKTRELNWNNGYLSFRKCENEKQNKKDCPITTPGTVIQNKLNSTLNLGTDRLILAEKFDQVVTAVIDQLITTAIDKTLETVNN
jgi:hypothetical protein